MTVILGAEAEIIRATMESLPVEVVIDPEWPSGMSSSIRLAARRIDADALLFVTCDQPHVTTEVLHRLMHARGGPHRIVASEYDGVGGVPALFERSLVSELQKLTGDIGAREIIRSHPMETQCIPFPDGSADLDTLEDIARLREVGALTCPTDKTQARAGSSIP